MGAGASSSGISSSIESSSSTELSAVLKDLPADAKSRLQAVLTSTEPQLKWIDQYGVFCTVSISDMDRLQEILLPEAETQVREEPGAPAFAVLGQPTANTYPLSELEKQTQVQLTKNRFFWVAYFDSHKHYHTDHIERESNKVFGKTFFPLMRNGMEAMTGSYRGMIFHLERPGASLSEFTYSVIRCAKARNADFALKLIEILKANGRTQLAAEPGALRCTIVPPGAIGLIDGDMPQGHPAYKDDRTVMWVESWRTAEDHAAHKETPHVAELQANIKELVLNPERDCWVIEFGQTAHFSKPSMGMGGDEPTPASRCPGRTDATSMVDMDCQISAVEVLRQIHEGERSCAAFAEQFLGRIYATNGVVNACVDVAEREELLRKAEAVDAKVRAREEVRPLEGLLMVVKLNIDTAGMLTTASTKALKDHRPAVNAPVVQALEVRAQPTPPPGPGEQAPHRLDNHPRACQ